jgi:uncharacterized protein (TIGR03435 family)
VISGQAPGAATEFEVASVKASEPSPPGFLRVRMGGDPGMVDYKNVTLKAVIARAYEIKDFQISGPEWLETARFDILAKTPPNTPKAQIPRMLQALLAQRFKLVVQREQRVMPVFAMVVGKGGFALKPLEGDPESRTTISVGPKGRELSGPTTMLDLAGMISKMMDRPVVDATGIKGTYDLHLEWVPDEREGGEMRAAVAHIGGGGGEEHGTVPEAASGQTLSGALRDTLGLKLEARKMPVDVVVVVRAEKVPTEN